MKKLNLLEPKLVKGFLEEGSGEPVSYLQVPEELTMQALEDDVNAGAIQFGECLDMAKKGLSRVVVVRANNEEDAFMAVNYLAGICNEKGNVSAREDDFEDSISGEVDIDDLLEEFDEYYNDYFDEDEECFNTWQESPRRVPVVTIEEIIRNHNSMDQIFGQNFIMAGMPNTRNRKPYWMECTTEAICVVINIRNSMFGGIDFDKLTNILQRFQRNKHLFLAVIDGHLPEGCFDIWDDQGILKYVLENTADMILVKTKEDKLKDYRLLQFENWLHELHIRLTPRFPKKEMVEKITGLHNEQKSALIKMVLKYVQKESRKDEDEQLTKEDFAILKKFKVLGLNESGDVKYSESLEKELVGMESVKEQVRSIVQVMKYNKCREQMGLGKGNYHNVHLLIGAPGTAKTTVAKLLGNMMREENLLPGNRFTCVNGADLKGMFVGHSAPKTKMLFQENDIILIDEAYSLVDENEHSDSFSQEAIAQLIIEIEEHAMDKLVMFAGYGGAELNEKDNKMKKFIDANPGLKSRINSTIYFDSYTPQQMVDIVHVQAGMQKFKISKDADEAIYKYFEARVGDANFGNGREARSLLENATVFAAARVMKLPDSKRTKKLMSEITCEDMMNAIERMKNNNTMQNGKTRNNCGFFGCA